MLYGTALTKEDGQVMFFNDIYGYDRRLERLLGECIICEFIELELDCVFPRTECRLGVDGPRKIKAGAT